MSTKTYQIHVELKGSKPRIWRRLLVPADVELSDLHKILQTAMGWTNSHMHHFAKDRNFYESPQPADDLWDSMGEDYTGLTLQKFLSKRNEKLTYEYDFGDGWEHTIKLEKIVKKDPDIDLPICTEGEMACPPEDCGGIWGYQELKKALNNPEHPEHEYYMEWLGNDFDPEEFSVMFVNEMLREEDYGVIGF